MDTPRTVGAGPLLRALCEHLGIRNTMDQVVPWDRQRCKLSPGERIQALVLNLKTSAPSLECERHSPACLPTVGGGRSFRRFTDSRRLKVAEDLLAGPPGDGGGDLHASDPAGTCGRSRSQPRADVIGPRFRHVKLHERATVQV